MDQGVVKLRINNFLDSRHFMNVATVDSEGRPHVALVAYSLHDDLKVCFLTHAKSKKVSNLGINSNVSFVVSDLDNPVTLQVDGVVEVLSDANEKVNLIRTLSEKIYVENSYLAPLLKLPRGEICAFCIYPTTMKLSDFSAMGEPVFYELDSNDLMDSAPTKTVSEL